MNKRQRLIKLKETKNKMLKNKRGITLIALVVTIVVILILAGITIGMIVDDNGIISKAKETRGQTIIANEKEIINRAKMSARISGQSEISTKEIVKKAIIKEAGNNKIEIIEEDEDLIVKFVETGNEYTVKYDKEPKIIFDKDKIEVSIEEGIAEDVSLTAITENITGELNWTSSNTDVATISGSGNTRTITVKTAGSAIIVVSSGKYTAMCNVTVKNATMIKLLCISQEGETTYCNAKEGMTWGEFVNNPRYNTIGLRIWNDIVIQSWEQLKNIAENNFKILNANTFFNAAGDTTLIFTWQTVDSSYDGKFMQCWPTVPNNTYSKEKLLEKVEAEGGTIKNWDVE